MAGVGSWEIELPMKRLWFMVEKSMIVADTTIETLKRQRWTNK